MPPIATNVRQMEDSRAVPTVERWMEELIPNTAPELPSPDPPAPIPQEYPMPSMVVMTAEDIYLTEDGRCNYVSETGKECGEKIGRNKYGARHWLTKHAMKEVELIERGKLNMRRATIITTPEKMEMARVYCCFSQCRKRRPKTCFIRPDAVDRHLVQCAERYDMAMSRKDVKVWIRKNMELKRHTPKSTFEWQNCWEAAIWRIYQAF